MSFKRIAFFDVDHTLIDGNSGYYTSLRLVKHGILKKRRIFQAVYYSLAALFFRQNVEKIYEIAIADMAGSPLTRILEIGQECFENDVKKLFYPEALTLLNQHQSQGDAIVLLSSGPYMCIEFVKKFVGAHQAYSMGPVIVDGMLTNKLDMPVCHAEGKIHFAQKTCHELKVPLENCSFYTDHYTDIPLLNLVGDPHAVNPDRKLIKHAQEKKWPIHRFNRSA